MQQPSIVASKFKCLRGLDTKQVTELLRNVAEGELSFVKLKQRAVEVKNMAALRTEFMKKAGCRSWKEAAERYSFNYYHFFTQASSCVYMSVTVVINNSYYELYQ